LQGDGVGGREYVREVQRARLLTAALDVIGEHGWEGMSVERVTRRAGMSSRTFYKVFAGREECFLGVFDGAVERLRGLAAEGYAREGDWASRLRGAVGALLGFLEYAPAVRRAVFIESQDAGPRVARARERMLVELAAIIEEGRRVRPRGRRPPPSAARDALDRALGVLERWLLEPRLLRQTFLLEPKPVPMCELLGELMSVLVEPYLGAAAARRELLAPAAVAAGASRPAGLEPRLTYRRLRVLEALAAHPGQNNREVADGAGIASRGQASKLLAQLQKLGLAETTGEPRGDGRSNAWRLTARGEEIEQTTRTGTR
jgi:AcrR family transcriptional regulator/DNA-binding MarR family transcriptional regulator